MKLQKVSEDVILEKYAKHDEKSMSGEDALVAIRRRVAKALSKAEKPELQEFWESEFFEAQCDGVLMGGRINSAAGTDLEASLLNCAVQPIADAMTEYVDGIPGIYPALAQSSEALRRGNGVGYDFSDIRPRGARVNSTKSSASGPVSYMLVYDQSCQTIESAGGRRGAQMATLLDSHPSIREFIEAKRSGALTHFNISVLITDEFMEAKAEGKPFQLVHKAEPGDEQIANGAFQREDGLWVYDEIDPNVLWDSIMENTYRQADPGVLYVSRINKENNLYYCETITATNPCGEIPLSSWGVCCLGSVNLTQYVSGFKCFDSERVAFDWERFKKSIRVAIRMLDNVLAVTYWSLEEQKKQSDAKRRVGLGITGLGSMLVMMGLRYDSEEGLQFAKQISEVLRDESYRASIDLAKEKGAFPLFDREKYLQSQFVQRLPADIVDGIHTHGIRNCHLLAIAPTGTISIISDNCSNGLEPAFSWSYTRNKKAQDGSWIAYDEVLDHAYRLYKERGGDTDNLPEEFVNALELTPDDHLKMVAVFAKNIDQSISKTINCPQEISYEDFKDIYQKAYDMGLKGVTTFRPNDITGSVLETSDSKDNKEKALVTADRKIQLDSIPTPALSSLRWPKRPETPNGNPGMTYVVKHPTNTFAVFIGHVENGKSSVFETWVNGQEAPRGISALAKSLSMDLRSSDRAFVKKKLEAIGRSKGEAFSMLMPGGDTSMSVPSVASALSRLIDHRCSELGNFDRLDEQEKPLLDAMFEVNERSDADGTMSWTVEIDNPNTGDDFTLILKEAELPDGSHRPFRLQLAGRYPEALNGLAESLSYDMRIIDCRWIARKLQSLSDFPEAQGDFFSKVPGADRSANQPSTVAYMARLLLHRYERLGILDADGNPVLQMGIFSDEEQEAAPSHQYTPGKTCPACNVDAVIRKDGCGFCTNCGAVGDCG